MPKSLLPPHGGPYSPAWQSGKANPSPGSKRDSEMSDPRAMKAEIERLRAEIARLKEDRQAGPLWDGKTVPVWAALALCGAALIFAIAAIYFHG